MNGETRNRENAELFRAPRSARRVSDDDSEIQSNNRMVFGLAKTLSQPGGKVQNYLRWAAYAARSFPALRASAKARNAPAWSGLEKR